MNCLGCIYDKYFYKNDTHDCIKPDEFNQIKNLGFIKLDYLKNKSINKIIKKMN